MYGFLEGSFPSQIASLPYLQDHQLIAKGSQIRKVFENPEDCLSGILAFLLVGIFDVSGVMFGLSVLAGLDKDHKDGYVYVPNSKWVFIASGLATMVAACLGCSPIIVHIESAAGIREGGRTGFTSIVVGFWFLLSLFFAPLFGSIPQEATAPVVILIGASMMGQACEIDWKQMRIAVPAFLTLAIMPFTFSIPNGIFFGLLSNFVLSISCRSSNNSDYHDDDPEHSNVSRHITEMGKTMSYGTAGNSNHSVSNFPRNYSTDSFIRSPTLILKAEEYSSTASFSQYGGGAYSQYGSTNSLKY